jgi:hypothetical protein
MNLLAVFSRLFFKKEFKFEEKIRGVFSNWTFDHYQAKSPEGYCLWIANDYYGFKDSVVHQSEPTSPPFLFGFKEWQRRLLYDELQREVRRRVYSMAWENRNNEEEFENLKKQANG